MKNPIIFVIIIILALASASNNIFHSSQKREQALLNSITEEKIISATVHIMPDNDSADLSDDQIIELAGILRTVELGKRDDLYKEMGGGTSVTYTLQLFNDVKTTISAYSGFIIINGTGYRAETICYELIALGSAIIMA